MSLGNRPSVRQREVAALGNGFEAFFAEMIVESEGGLYPQAAHGLKGCAVDQA